MTDRPQRARHRRRRTSWQLGGWRDRSTVAPEQALGALGSEGSGSPPEQPDEAQLRLGPRLRPESDWICAPLPHAIGLGPYPSSLRRSRHLAVTGRLGHLSGRPCAFRSLVNGAACGRCLGLRLGRWADFGRNALTTRSSVSTYGAESRSRQYGTAAKMPGTTDFPVSSLTLKRLANRLRLFWQVQDERSFANHAHLTRQDRAVGTKCRLIRRICSPKPGITLSATLSVASGVTSRGAGPVPPVVSTRDSPLHPPARSVHFRSLLGHRESGASPSCQGRSQRRRKPLAQRRDFLCLRITPCTEARSADRGQANPQGSLGLVRACSSWTSPAALIPQLGAGSSAAGTGMRGRRAGEGRYGSGRPGSHVVVDCSVGFRGAGLEPKRSA